MDYITYEDTKKVKKALQELGFHEKAGYYRHQQCPWFVEFVSPPIAVGNEPVHTFNSIETPLGTIKLLHPTDSVKDRLVSFYHWNDKQGLEQALSICLEHKIDLVEVKKWSNREGHLGKFLLFAKGLEEIRKSP